ncbi:chitinase-like protein Idgf1 [Bactrocera neohumeralis]|uniref:chitinase-like protein Idgf1 n=1 Tax=Bactrocera tryoni TaxID=59916 RepID=UPI001A95BB82|nr:chitinase-like protein Idgf1 [Bactrocera tryoni]XP_050319005.1 chitinase-like protein Idgf1 [Bactrocera neohumeralis]
MRFLNALALLCAVLIPPSALAADKNLVCFYDSASYLRQGFAKLLPTDLELGLNFCSHLIYGYAGLKPQTHEVYSLNVDLDMFHYHEILLLKAKYPKMKVFLSVGGDRDVDEANPLKYLGLLESGKEGQQSFIDSSIALLKRNGFDGLDLALQLPRNKPRKVHGTVGSYWKKFKKLFTGDFVVDPQASEHKEQFTDFSKNLRDALQRANLSLALTVLPNVNSTWYFDVPKIQNNFEFINLLAFDFLTPTRNPDEADYTAPIYPLTEQNRLPHYNIEYQVDYWLKNQCPGAKINLGIATYGRAWKLTPDSGLSGVPVVAETDGPAPAGLQSQIAGLLSWPEICAKMPNNVNADYRGENAPLRKVTDLEQRYGNYALRPADENGEHGMWVSYDDPDFAAIKASYVRTKGLGGVALYDLSYDDFRGLCTGLKFPILRAIKHFL